MGEIMRLFKIGKIEKQLRKEIKDLRNSIFNKKQLGFRVWNLDFTSLTLENRIQDLEKNISLIMDYLNIESKTTEKKTKMVKKSKP